jgi:6-phospho-beta-glucosidase
MKVTVIGGGSTYTPELIEGLSLWNLHGGPDEVVLHDIFPDRLEVVSGFSARMAARLNSGLKVTAEPDFRTAIDGADFVVFQIRVGGQKERHEDIRMGLDLGIIGQETTGVGGFAKALRTIPAVLEMARAIRDHNPNAWIINFTNPSGIVTEAIIRFATTRCVGLCNVPKEFQMDVARHLRMEADKVRLDWVGLNHLGWARRIFVDGRDVLPQLVESLSGDYGPQNIPDLDYPKGFLSALRMIPSSYVRYYYLPDRMLEELQQRPQTRAEDVMDIEEQLLDYYKDQSNCDKPMALSERGGAWYSRIAVEVMESLSSSTPKNLIVNTLNLGTIDGLPGDASIEVPAEVSTKGIAPIHIGEVEECIMGLIRQVKSYERLAIAAAVSRDKDKALMALMANPLVPSADKAIEVLKRLQIRDLI